MTRIHQKMLRKFILTVMTFLIMTCGSSAGAEGFLNYPDMPEDWSKESIVWAVEQNVMTGDNGFIRPDHNIKRAELAAMLVRLLNVEVETDISNYTDVRIIAWYHPYIKKSVAAEIMTGANGLFRPEDYITREEAATAIARAFDFSAINNDSSLFNDFENVSDWAREYLIAMIEGKIITGDENNCINPKNMITRKETAAILYRCKHQDVTPFIDNDGSVWTPIY